MPASDIIHTPLTAEDKARQKKLKNAKQQTIEASFKKRKR
jgi:hypothetical protein